VKSSGNADNDDYSDSTHSQSRKVAFASFKIKYTRIGHTYTNKCCKSLELSINVLNAYCY
jgi:hypothetical protein